MSARLSSKSMHLPTIIFPRDIEPLVVLKKDQLKSNYVQRILAFSLSGTYIVDLKDSS